MTATLFSDLVASLAPTEAGWAVTATDDWRQGRTLYGGISAALCLAAAQRTFPETPPLRSAQISFIGPAVGPVELRPALLRQGKSAAFVGCDLLSDGQIGTRAVFCFGGVRPSAYARSAPPAPQDIPPPDECEAYFSTDAGPAFRRHFDLRLARGGRPYSGAEPDIWLWARHTDTAAPADAVALLALADAPPPAAMSEFSAMALISSMTWMVDVLDAAGMATPGWKLLRSTAETNAEGYSAQAMTIWGEDGRALVAGRQSVAVFG
jgi:acyl-CoA thioesterase